MSEEVKDGIVDSKLEIPQEGSSASEPSKFSDVEIKAMAKGWRPQTQYLGDPDDFVAADDFMRNYTWVKEIKKLNSKLEDKARLIDKLVEHNSKIEELTYKKALEELNKKLEDAALIGDTPTVKQINQQMIDLKVEETRKSVPVANKLPDYVEDFTSRNSDWFNDSTAFNSAMKAYAIRVADEIAKQSPNMDPRAQLRLTEDKVKQAFPSSFDKSVSHDEAHNADRVSVSKVESGVSNTPKSKKITLNDLPKDLKEMGLHLQKTSKRFDLDTYINQVKLIHGL